MPLTKEQARQNLQALIEKYDSFTERERINMTETDTVNQFIVPMLRDVLGWDTNNPDIFKYERTLLDGKRPDITLIRTDDAPPIFVEAKAFNRIGELKPQKNLTATVIKPADMALPNQSIDRTKEEQQAINYAFNNNGQWAILTNFERFRLFNARRDWLVVSFETPKAYLEDFDTLWQLSYDRILSGELERLSNQRYTADVDTQYLDLINTWRQNLADDVLQRQAQNPWVVYPDGGINLPLLRHVVQRFLDRLVVIRFAEDHYVLNPGALRAAVEIREVNEYTFTMSEFLQRFFSRFDHKHNGALFMADTTDKAEFSDEVLTALVEDLYKARYRTMPADILGNTYEQYLGKVLTLVTPKTVAVRDNLETRKKQGTYYTPTVIVEYMVDNSLGRYLYGTANGKPDGEPLPDMSPKTSADIHNLRVLDSACGSGSFLIYAYQVLADFYERERRQLLKLIHARKRDLLQQGTSPLEVAGDTQILAWEIERERLDDYPRFILENHIYGVDLDPQAAEIAVVNLMMRALERPNGNKRLPLILNQNVKVGNALIGLRPDDPRLDDHRPTLGRMAALRRELATTPNLINKEPNPRHKVLLEELRTLEAELLPTLDAHFNDHFEDVAAVQPFHWAAAFPDVFVDATGAPLENGGFTMIVGNPPWEIVKPDIREYYAQFDENIESKYTRNQVEQRIEELHAENPTLEAEWDALRARIEASAAYYRASADFTRQGRGDTATHKLFTERMFHLLRNGGRLGYVIPSGVYTDLGTKDLREMLLNEGGVDYLFSMSNERFFFRGVDHRFKFAMIGVHKGNKSDGFKALFRFNPRVAVAPEDFAETVANPDNLVYIRQDSIARFSPDSLSIMEFQSQRDYDIAAKIYGAHPLIGDEGAAWTVKFTNEFHMTNDRKLFNQTGKGLPLYQGKTFHQFDAFYGEPEYWIDEAKGAKRLERKTGNGYQDYRLIFRDIASATNERTLISAIIPKNSFCNNKAPIVLLPDTDTPYQTQLYTLALFNSFALDFLIRFKVSTSLNFFYMYTLPLPRLSAGDPHFDALVELSARLTCTHPAYDDLWRDVMGNTPRQTLSDNDRQALRDEIDARVAHLFGLSRSEFAHVLRSFPLVFPDGAGIERVLAAYDAT